MRPQFFHTMATRRQAEQAAQKFMICPGVEGVELFGSIAREGLGNDVDLILIVSDMLAEEFSLEVRSLLATGRYKDDDKRDFCDAYGAAVLRRWAATRTLGGRTFRGCYDRAVNCTMPNQIEVFLFPADWRERLDELQAAYPHKDPEFLRNIAKDAIKLC